jgi:hypothetical protein
MPINPTSALINPSSPPDPSGFVFRVNGHICGMEKKPLVP